MGLTKFQTEKADIPHEPGEHMVLRKALSGYTVEEGKMRSGSRALDLMKKAYGPQLYASLTKNMFNPEGRKQMEGERQKLLAAGNEAAPVEASAKTLNDVYDMDWLASKLVVSWSYRDDNNRPVKPTLEHIRDLDGETQRWLYERVADAMRMHIDPEDLAGN